MTEILDDKSEHCIPFILSRLEAHRAIHAKDTTAPPPPFFLGLNGVQGAGKSTLVATLCNTLTSPPHNLPTVVLSIDDLYLPHDQQLALAAAHSDNPLVQHRGQPSTHDILLGTALFKALRNREQNVKIPSYDKSRFNGQGDRAGPEFWGIVNKADEKPIEVVVFEGWCVGFRPLTNGYLEKKWREAKEEAEKDTYEGQLGRLDFESIELVNDALRQYDDLTDELDAFIHIDAEQTQYVYDWRLQQEAALRQAKGTGMTDEQVINFVNGYYPAYELYTEVLRHGIYHEEGKQMRLVVDKTRKVKEVHKI